MMRQETMTLAGTRGLTRALRELGTAAAPDTLAPAVLRGVGLSDAYAAIDSPLGRLFVAYSNRGVSMVARTETGAEFEQLFRARFGRPAGAAAELPPILARALARHLEGRRAPLRFDLRGISEFERAVLLKALEIPRGEVRPYAWIAREIGAPKAVRAVGSALGHNPVPLLIPCHRVVRSDGLIGNYSLGGGEAKRAVLTAEGVDPAALEQLARSGVRYHGSTTTRIYCFPTCRNARRISGRRRVPFGSEAEAVAAGYRPCKVCRPARAG